jgi:predicted MFS family arabinose efflux permease
MIIGNFIIGLVLISFTFTKNIYMILVVISTVGIGNACVTSTTGTYITLSREARKIGASKLSSIFKSFQKLGAIAGPMLIGILISIYGYIEAMTAIGVMILCGLLFFIILSSRLRR